MYHLRRLSALVLSLAIAPLLFLPTPAAAAANEDSMPLVLSSASALLMEKETGTVLLQQNAHQKLEPASVTKIMTLLLVMEAVDLLGRLSLDELVPVSAHAAGMGGSQVYLKEGELSRSPTLSSAWPWGRATTAPWPWPRPRAASPPSWTR
ncbi:MAG: serine hydrolase [Lawsonibacter sp.]